MAELLWIAPELIPLTVTPGSTATQKGDVYSFAIILEEIVVRGGPYESVKSFITSQEVYKNFKIILNYVIPLFVINIYLFFYLFVVL